ncbi:MAG: hypothetical protein J6K03_08550 [Oscillospiraceae bacterium]|nr:hypothetical protein [Oscillospiraceae bacterium]
MNFLEKVIDVWGAFSEKASPVLESLKEIFTEVGKILYSIGSYIYKMRKIFLAVPVVWAAIYLAIYNQTNLPAVVGLDLQTTGDFAIQLARELAVLIPLVITAVCLLLMFCSRRILTPWLVSMFSLVIPIVILLLNTFPA